MQSHGGHDTFAMSVQKRMDLPANVPVSEQELSAQVALLNDIVISDCDLTLGAYSQTQHGKVFDELTSQGSSPNKKHLQTRSTEEVCTN